MNTFESDVKLNKADVFDRHVVLDITVVVTDGVGAICITRSDVTVVRFLTKKHTGTSVQCEPWLEGNRCTGLQNQCTKNPENHKKSVSRKVGSTCRSRVIRCMTRSYNHYTNVGTFICCRSNSLVNRSILFSFSDHMPSRLVLL